MRFAFGILILALLQLQPATPRAAVERALPLLQRSAAEFVSKRSCFSCHHNALPILTLRMAKAKGFRIDSAALAAVEEKTFNPLLADDALDQSIQVANLSDPTPNESYLLMAAAAAGLDRSLTTAVRAEQILSWQEPDGHWVTSDFRPPHSSSYFTATATAIRAIAYYAPPELQARKQRAIAQARAWLQKTAPASTEDAAFRLMGLVWSNSPARVIASAKVDLLALQSTDGGWPQLRGYPSDGYSTGESLFALREAAVEPSDAAWQRGAQFLLRDQASDGTWHVRSRMLSPAEVSPPYFSTGFPYGKDEFLSYAGTSWAVMALLRSESETAPITLKDSPDPNPWMRTALFGTANQLARLLDTGLSVNTKTNRGTSLLMAAAPDANKVSLLLSRGADVKTRGRSGHDALTVAAAHRNTTASLKALLDAHADATPPDGVRVHHSPLVFAAMSGDLSNVKLLVNRGADASDGSALAEAITFGHTDVARALIQAGADTALTEASGVNLLHWATITGRAPIIPFLVKAGVPLDDTDKAGFTPLMYAATVDLGSTATLRALLAAGADTKIRNPEGRTALELATHFKHDALAKEFTLHH